MRPDQFECFVSPTTQRGLALQDVCLEDGHVHTAKLAGEANGQDGTVFHVRDFIPRFTETEGYTTNFGLQWQRHAKTQVDSHNGATYSRDRLFDTTGWSRDGSLEGRRILEAGSGSGRFTEIIAGTGATLYSFDFSEAVVANFSTNGQRDNVAIFQASIYEIPLKAGTFDHVICLGVLQHTPDPKRSFMCLAKMVRPGGQLIVDLYARNLRRMLHWKYLMRPVATRVDPERLYRFVSWYAPKLMPLARALRKVGGRALPRLVPILDQSDKDVPREIQRDWTILDTYDALAATYDYPQTAATVRRWYEEAGFTDLRISEPGVVAGVGTAP